MIPRNSKAGHRSVRLVGPRGRSIVRAGTWSLLAKLSAAANLFLTVPFVLQALGSELFGVWATLVSLTTFATFLDFGLGNGTMNLVAAAHGRGARGEVLEILSESRRTLLWISGWLGVGVLLTFPLVPVERFLGTPGIHAEVTRYATAIVLLTIVVAVPLNLANRVQLGLGRGERAFQWQALGQVLSTVMVILLAVNHASLPALVAASVATPLLASAANTWLLTRDSKLPHASSERRPELRSRIRREGLLFFVLQVSAALAFAADLPLISSIRGPADAGIYAIVQRLFSIIPLALGLIWVPLWPIYRQALAAGDHLWVSRTLHHSFWAALLGAGAGALVLYFLFAQVTAVWLRQPLIVSSALLAGYATWSVVDSAGSAIGAFLNAASILRFQVIVGATFASICFVTKIWALSKFGIAAMPWVTVTTYCLLSLLPVRLFWPGLKQTAFQKKY